MAPLGAGLKGHVLEAEAEGEHAGRPCPSITGGEAAVDLEGRHEAPERGDEAGQRRDVGIEASRGTGSGHRHSLDEAR